MVSLKDVVVATGASTDGSLLAAANALGLTPPISLLELSSESLAQKPFLPLLILEDGVGDFRVDQLRVYFQTTSHMDGEPQPLFSADALKTEIANNFPKFFNGRGTDHDDAMSRNIAEVGFRNDKKFNDEVTMQFRLDMNTLFGTVDIFDHHDDWVGFVQDDAGVFSVQTLERRFRTEEIDSFLEENIENIFELFPALSLSGIAGEATQAAAKLLAERLNRMHFLAGRRSWSVRHMLRAENPLISGAFTDIFFFETATIDRFSSIFSRLIGALGGAAFGNVDKQTIVTWSVLLENFVKHHRSVGVANFNFAIPGQDFELPEVSPFPHDFQNRNGPVFFNQQSFSTQTSMMNMPWVQKMLTNHSALSSQL